MKLYSGNYTPSYTPTFQDQLIGLNPAFKKHIEEKIQSLSNDPYHNTEFMKGSHRGRRKARLNDTDRLAFVVCEECRKLGHRQYNLCSDCATTPDNTIVIAYLILGHDY